MHGLRSVMCGFLMATMVCGARAGESDPSKPVKDGDAEAKPEPKAKEEDKKKHDREPTRENRLAKETSPYLLLHKTNPVDWYPWSAEALAKAKRENKLIFLSIGYSSCHWCHVMERESFMNKEIAAILNKHFVSIKVDREERPDVDDVYMTALHVLGRRGGWPLSMFLTPDAKPIIGGTYFPPDDLKAPNGQIIRPGFGTILESVRETWEKQPEGVERQAEVVSRAVRANMKSQPADAKALDRDIAAKVYENLADPNNFDAEFGGFGYSAADPDRPKFPEPSNLMFLLDLIERTNDEKKKAHAQKMLTKTLDMMAAGGMWDHVGGGFHRYSVDRFWHVPHFEKMLYDNGQLASVYARAYALTGNKDYREIVERIIEFSDREMRDKDGGYYSALDAESDHKEGGFYIWQRDEIRDTLEEDEYELAAAVYNLDKPPNFKDPHSDDTAYVLLRLKPLAELAKEQKISVKELESRLADINEKLFKQRAPRKRPLLDTKILTGWNGLMIRGLADAGRFLKKDEYTISAERAAEFVLNNLRTDEGRLLRTHTDGEAKLNAYLVDYAYLIDGLIALHEATGNKKWLDEADTLMKKQLALFADKDDAGFFFTSDDHESLFARSKRAHDGARPSGNSVTANNLIYLAKALDNASYLAAARKTVLAFKSISERAPGAMPLMAIAVNQLPEEATKETDVEREPVKTSETETEAPQTVAEILDSVKEQAHTEKDAATGPNFYLVIAAAVVLVILIGAIAVRAKSKPTVDS